MAKECYFCDKVINNIPFKCNYCGLVMCSEHRLPEKHNCDNLSEANSPTIQRRSTLSKFNDSTNHIRGSSYEFQENQILGKFSKTKFLIPLLLAFLIFPLGGTFAYGLWWGAWRNNLTHEEFYLFSNIIHFSTQMLCVVVLVFFARFSFHQSLKERLRVDKPNLSAMFQIFLAMIFFTGIVIDQIVPPVPNLPRPLSSEELIFDLLATLVGAPIMEELIFRKLLIPSLKRNGTGDLYAALFSGITFALIHTPQDIAGYGVAIGIGLVLSRAVGGIYLALAYIYTKKVIYPIMIHFLWNFYVSFNSYTQVYWEINSLKTLNTFFIWTINITAIVYGIYIIFAKYFHRDTIWEHMLESRSALPARKSLLKTFIAFIFLVLIYEVILDVITLFAVSRTERYKDLFTFNFGVLTVVLFAGYWKRKKLVKKIKIKY